MAAGGPGPRRKRVRPIAARPPAAVEMVKAALAVHEFFQKTLRGFYASAEIKATSFPAPRQDSAVPGSDNTRCNAFCRTSPSTKEPREHGVDYRVIEEPAQDFPGFRQVLAAIGEPTPPDATPAFRRDNLRDRLPELADRSIRRLARISLSFGRR